MSLAARVSGARQHRPRPEPARLKNSVAKRHDSAAERHSFQMVSDPDQPVTYGRLMREKDQIRRALDGDIWENPLWQRGSVHPCAACITP